MGHTKWQRGGCSLRSQGQHHHKGGREGEINNMIIYREEFGAFSSTTKKLLRDHGTRHASFGT